MKKLFFKKGATIFNEGALGDCAYIIESGSVKVSRTLVSGEEQLIGILDEMDILGEMGLIDSLPRSADVTALEDCTVSVLTTEDFHSISKNNPEALMPILKVLSKRVRNALKIVENQR